MEKKVILTLKYRINKFAGCSSIFGRSTENTPTESDELMVKETTKRKGTRKKSKNKYYRQFCFQFNKWLIEDRWVL